MPQRHWRVARGVLLHPVGDAAQRKVGPRHAHGHAVALDQAWRILGACARAGALRRRGVGSRLAKVTARLAVDDEHAHHQPQTELVLEDGVGARDGGGRGDDGGVDAAVCCHEASVEDQAERRLLQRRGAAGEPTVRRQPARGEGAARPSRAQHGDAHRDAHRVCHVALAAYRRGAAAAHDRVEPALLLDHRIHLPTSAAVCGPPKASTERGVHPAAVAGAARENRKRRERNGPARTRHANIHIARKAARVALQAKARPLGEGCGDEADAQRRIAVNDGAHH
eukprot:scaffold8536_cov84-Phaeocystis_antarctica.AAC.2